MLNFEKKPSLKTYLRGVLNQKLNHFQSKSAFEKALLKYSLLDPTEEWQNLQQQNPHQRIQEELQKWDTK